MICLDKFNVWVSGWGLPVPGNWMSVSSSCTPGSEPPPEPRWPPHHWASSTYFHTVSHPNKSLETWSQRLIPLNSTQWSNRPPSHWSHGSQDDPSGVVWQWTFCERDQWGGREGCKEMPCKAWSDFQARVFPFTVSAEVTREPAAACRPRWGVGFSPWWAPPPCRAGLPSFSSSCLLWSRPNHKEEQVGFSFIWIFFSAASFSFYSPLLTFISTARCSGRTSFLSRI